ncbi:uncharacterized protein LOC143025939 [Oratosquilla oratoria]|uniref:uncharacterized protein LOC143025939 n=1 Tax=Oratosquilla oratoria TaxID=337810 RepID=UPI003F765F53
MANSLSAVMVCLFMEVLEMDRYITIMGRGTTWLRYVDEIIVAIPKGTSVENKLRRLNTVNKDIQFTVELEKEGKLPFLYTLLYRGSEQVSFSVYRKPINRDNFIHYFSAHSGRVKTSVLIGFFLRTFRICRKRLLEDELAHIKNTFKKLKYPGGLAFFSSRHVQDNTSYRQAQHRCTYNLSPHTLNHNLAHCHHIQSGRHLRLLNKTHTVWWIKASKVTSFDKLPNKGQSGIDLE